jgi:FixJ family two-component response regulator
LLFELAHREIGVPKRLLVAIVDDDESIRNTTKDLLESAGFAAAVFARAASLLKSRRLSQVCCLIADMRMPKMTGLELHRHLVASNRAIPTIIITAYPDERAQAQASEQFVRREWFYEIGNHVVSDCLRRAVRSHADSRE